MIKLLIVSKNLSYLAGSIYEVPTIEDGIRQELNFAVADLESRTLCRCKTSDIIKMDVYDGYPSTVKPGIKEIEELKHLVTIGRFLDGVEKKISDANRPAVDAIKTIYRNNLTSMLDKN